MMLRDLKISSAIIILCIIMSGCHQADRLNPNLIEDESIQFYHVTRSDDSRVIGTLIDGKKYGYWITTNDKGVVILEICYENDTANGRWYSYHNSGELFEQGFYNEGESDSIFMSYFGEGLLADSGRFEDGQKMGVWKHYELMDSEYKLAYKIMYSDSDTTLIFDGELFPPRPDGLPEWKTW